MKEKIYSKKSKKFLDKIDPESRQKIEDAIANEKNMSKLAKVGKHGDNRWRIKLEHFRVIMIDRENQWYVDTIDTKTNCKMRKAGYF